LLEVRRVGPDNILVPLALILEVIVEFALVEVGIALRSFSRGIDQGSENSFYFLSFNEELLPFTPVPGVQILSVRLLLMNVGFVRNFENSVEDDLTNISPLLAVGLFLEDTHVVVSLPGHFNVPLHLLLHLEDTLLFTLLSVAQVNFPSLLVPDFSELSVLSYYILALVGTPLFIEELFFLLGFLLHPGHDLLLSVPVLHLHVGL